MINILLVDDHTVVRQGLRMFLELDSELQVVGEARDGEEALAQVEKLKPDVVLMDLLMPRLNGIDAIKALAASHPEVHVLALTSVLDDRSVVEAVRGGASGYLLKDTQAEDLCRAIHAVHQGKVQLSPEAAARLVREVCIDEPQLDTLTARERDVLRLLAGGASNKEIASKLSLAEKTVKNHVSNLLSKLGLQSRMQAALWAVQKGWAKL
jgi:DNA-binding NarL/FixJ family response regulator